MRVCLVYPGYPPHEQIGGGISVFGFELAHALSDSGLRVTVLSRGPASSRLEREHLDGIELVRVPGEDPDLVRASHEFSFNRFGSFLFSQHISVLIDALERRDGAFDVIEFPDWGAEGFCSIASKQNRCLLRCFTPSFVSESFNPANPEYLSPFTKDLEREMLRRARHLSCNSTSLIELIESSIGQRVHYEREEAVFDVRRFQCQRHMIEEFSDARPLHILAVGRLEERKGFDVLITAMRELFAAKLPIEAVICGASTHLADGGDSIQVLARNAPPNIRFIPPVSYCQIAQQYQAADVMVVPSRFDSYPFVAVEAMSAGMPVIASHQCTISEHMVERETGLIFESNNPSDLICKIKYLYEQPGEITRIGSNAQALALGQFSKEATVPAIIARYQKIAQFARENGDSSKA